MGAGGPEFKSRRPDQNISRVFFRLMKAHFTQNSSVEFCQTGVLNSQVVYFPESSPHDEFGKTRGGRSAIQKLLNGRKLIGSDLASMGRIRGTLRISRLIDLRKCKSVNHALGSASTSPCLSQLLPHSLVEVGKCDILAAVC